MGEKSGLVAFLHKCLSHLPSSQTQRLFQKKYQKKKNRVRDGERPKRMRALLEWGRKRKEGRDRDKDNVCGGEKKGEKKKRMDEMKWEKGEII